MRLIDADILFKALAIIDRLRTDGHINNKEQGTLRRVILLPERPHGEWITWEEAGNYIASPNRHECSCCHDSAQVLVNGIELLSDFCPNCGADMRVKDELNNELKDAEKEDG